MPEGSDTGKKGSRHRAFYSRKMHQDVLVPVRKKKKKAMIAEI